MTTMEDLKKLKVAELRDELTKRDLETKGVKDELIARLWESMSAEQPDASTPAPENAPDPVASPVRVGWFLRFLAPNRSRQGIGAIPIPWPSHTHLECIVSE